MTVTKTQRILLFSSARPLRTWKIARRIMQEIPGAKICGIVQQPAEKLSLAQWLIASGSMGRSFPSAHALPKLRRLFRPALEELLHWIVWLIHGCPRGLNDTRRFTIADLTENCRQAQWPFLLARNIDDPGLPEFIHRQNAGMVLVLGELFLSPELLAIPSQGIVRACSRQLNADRTQTELPCEIRVEYFARGSEAALSLASLAVPLQPYDGLAGYALKTDLITDDMLVQTITTLQTENPADASKAVGKWIDEMFSPYLIPLEHTRAQVAQAARPNRRLRSVWKLCVETLLFSPGVAIQNWYRRWRGQYPVLILAHHLVCDRPHRMGISTEEFWQVARFLQRHYRIVSLAQAIELLGSGEVREPTVVLTFDDGYVDNFVSLRAVADEMEIPVALFIATQPVEMQHEFQHDLAHGIRGVLPLTWEQIHYWSVRGGEFGSHTRTHCDCASTERVKLEWELVGSKNDLECRLGKPVNFFAFPFGKHENISSDAEQMAMSVYSHFVSCFGGENLTGTAVSDYRHLFRKNLYSSLWELELELQSVFDRVETMKGKFGRRRTEVASLPGRASIASAFESIEL